MNPRFKTLFPLLVAMLLAAPFPGLVVSATSAQALPVHQEAAHGTDPEHFCATLVPTENERAQLAAIMATRRANGNPPLFAQKSIIAPQIGDQRNFNVLIQPSSSPGEWSSLTFRLVDISNLYHMWVQVGQWGTNVNQGEIDALRSRLLGTTPAPSIDPAKGIIQNNHDIFGLPPNVDGDGIVDIVLYDIAPPTSGLLGFVSSVDVTPGQLPGVGNQRDILYLDAKEGTFNQTTLAAVAAHEYTHLIHLSHGLDQTFLTEGFAEYASVMNGYYWRGIEYLDDQDEVQLPLFTWRSGDNVQVLKDYQRAGLFFTYIAEQHSPQLVGRMMQDDSSSAARSIDHALHLEDSSIGEIISGFHTANILQNRSINPAFGYVATERNASISNEMTRPVIHDVFDGEQITISDDFENPSGYFTHAPQDDFFGGAVTYKRWDHVSDLELRLEALFLRVYEGQDNYEQERQLQHGRLRARVVLDYEGDERENDYLDLTALEMPALFEGRFDRVDVYFMLTNPDLPSVSVEWMVNWTPLSQATVTESPEIPAATLLGPAWPNPFGHEATIPITLKEPGHVRLEVFDMLGRQREVLLDQVLAAGHHQITLPGQDLPSGTYAIRLTTGGGPAVTRLITRKKQ